MRGLTAAANGCKCWDRSVLCARTRLVVRPHKARLCAGGRPSPPSRQTDQALMRRLVSVPAELNRKLLTGRSVDIRYR